MEKSIFSVTSYDSNADQLYDGLGIGKERAEVLCKNIVKYFNEEGGNVSVVIEKISNECKTAEELSFVCFHLGRTIGKSENPAIQKVTIKPKFMGKKGLRKI